MQSHALTFIHLSDIHFNKNSGDSYDLDSDLRNELLADVRRMQGILDGVSGILISGDIAYSGKQNEYDKAEEFLFPLCQLLQIPETSVYCVPGNHDIDQSTVKTSHCLMRAQSAIESATDHSAEIAEFMRDPNSKTMMFSHMHEYNNFSAKFGCNIDADKQVWNEDLKLNDGSLLRLYGLNSVIISSHCDHPERRMVLGEAQTPRSENGVTYLSLGHHPPDLWKDPDATKQKLQARVHVQLYGHKHAQRIDNINDRLILYSGAAHPARAEKEWRPRYNWLALHVDGTGKDRSLGIRVYPRVLRGDNSEFIADSNCCGGELFREYTLPLDEWNEVNSSSSEAVEMSHTREVEKDMPEPIDAYLNNPTRALVFRFFGLSYTTRVSLLDSLGLLRDEDDGIEHTTLIRTLLERARSEGVLEQLWDKIETAHGDGKYRINPYAKQ